MDESRKVRLGVVGTGKMGQAAHLPNFLALDACEVVALAEMRRETGRLVAARHGIDRIYDDHRAMLDAEQLDGVVAIQPFARHVLLLPEIYARVKYVFTEKPLAVSVTGGEQLVAAADAAGCTHLLGYHKRSDPATMQAKTTMTEWRESGEVGALRYIRITMPIGDYRAGGGKSAVLDAGDPHPSLDMETPPADMDAATADRYLKFLNYFCHQLDLLRHLLDEPYQLAYADPAGVVFAARSASGIPAVIELAPYTTTRGWHESVLIAFERGYIRLNLPAPLVIYRAGTLEIYKDAGDGSPPERTAPVMPSLHAMRQQAIHVVEAMQGRPAPLGGQVEALEDLRIADQYARSLA